MSARTLPPADLPVVISSWGIECCGQPTAVGESTSWRLAFEPVATPDPKSADRIPGSVTEQLRQVEGWPGADNRRALYRNGFAAYDYGSTLTDIQRRVPSTTEQNNG